MARAAEVHSLLVGTFAEQGWSDVANAHHLGHGHAKHFLDVVADGGYAAARLSAGDDMRQFPSPLPLTLDPSPLKGRGSFLFHAIREVLRERRGRKQRVGEA